MKLSLIRVMGKWWLFSRTGERFLGRHRTRTMVRSGEIPNSRNVMQINLWNHRLVWMDPGSWLRESHGSRDRTRALQSGGICQIVTELALRKIERRPPDHLTLEFNVEGRPQNSNKFDGYSSSNERCAAERNEALHAIAVPPLGPHDVMEMLVVIVGAERGPNKGSLHSIFGDFQNPC